MIARRRLLIAAGASALVAPFGSFAQKQGKVWRIGFLGPTSAAGIAKRLAALRAGLRELGYLEGKNLSIDFRWAEGEYSRLPGLAQELVALNPDLIVTHTAPGTIAAGQATRTIPIVMMAVGDAIASGLVTNMARPGGNITGLSFFTPELNEKRLEMVKETLPQIRRVAFLYNSSNNANPVPVHKMHAVAAKLKLELIPVGVTSPYEFENAMTELRKQNIGAVAIYDDAMLIANSDLLARLATRQRVPSFGFSEIAEPGGLLAYGVDLPALAHRSAAFADKILRGANPGELPIEQPTKFELVINMKTAKALGIKIPQSILVRADRVIE